MPLYVQPYLYRSLSGSNRSAKPQVCWLIHVSPLLRRPWKDGLYVIPSRGWPNLWGRRESLVSSRLCWSRRRSDRTAGLRTAIVVDDTNGAGPDLVGEHTAIRRLGTRERTVRSQTLESPCQQGPPAPASGHRESLAVLGRFPRQSGPTSVHHTCRSCPTDSSLGKIPDVARL